ncbi:hypothetical protein B6U90_02240 [Thermoplasmatales archaeon ex4484_6]|nr:MAG: hypothetical protein B6U90_02240 [Thermoplasmatales archaeon ex4484_6]
MRGQYDFLASGDSGGKDPLVIIAVLSIIMVSGFVQGLAGFGSALVALPLLSLFMLPNVVTFLVFSVSGILTPEILLLSTLLLPPLAVGILAGERVSSMVGEGAFRKVALLLVLAAGLISLASGLFAIAG